MESNSLETAIEEYLGTAGAPLELRVLEAFAGKGIGRLPGLRYLAGDTIREIDLVATFESHALWKKEHFSLLSRVVVECKKSNKLPWVFFTTDSYTWDDRRPFLLMDSPVDKKLIELGRLPQILPLLQSIDVCHLNDREIPMAINYDEAFRKTGTPSSIYSAIESISNYMETVRKRSPERPEILDSIHVYFPVIVIDGALTVASMQGGKIRVRQAEHVHLRTWTGRDLLVIDVVTPAAFAGLVGRIEQFHKKAGSLIEGLSLPDEIALSLKLRNIERTRNQHEWKGEFLARQAIRLGLDLNQKLAEVEATISKKWNGNAAELEI